ncbi:MAG TPA: hypothetical protein VMV70_09930 [Gallionella sp.]|nr:hypothetical protein [Gallionella sp.]
MDNKTIFVRTSTGEEQVQSRTSHLSGDVKRALSMVDGISTFGEISKRAAPSMRASLAEMFEELDKSGLIQEKSFAGKIPKSSMPPQMVIPVKIATPRKPAAANKSSGELDFMSGFNTSTREVSASDGQAEKLRDEKEKKSRLEIDAEKARAKQEAEALLREAEQEARQRLEAAAREQREAEVARIKAEQEARRVREELEAAKLKVEREARLRLEAAERERKEAEAARIKAELEAKRVREELEAAKLKVEREARLRLEAAERERKEAEAARIKAEEEARLRREAEERERKEAEAARIKAEQEAKLRLEAEERERKEAEAARIKKEQEAARIRIEKEAARVKAEEEAAQRQIELELARRKAELEAAALLEAQVQAAARKQAEEEAEQARTAAIVREIDVETEKPSGATAGKTGSFAFDEFKIDEFPQPPGPQKKSDTARKSGSGETATAAAKQDAFAFDSFNVDETVPPAEPPTDRPAGVTAEPARPAEEIQTAGPAAPPLVDVAAADHRASQEKLAREKSAREKSDRETRARLAEEARTKEQADAQARVWAEAEQRALEAARTHAERAAHLSEHPPETPRAEKMLHAARSPRKPFAWNRLAGNLLMLGLFLLVLLIGALFVIPYFLPMRDYMPRVQQLLSDELHQPVHLGYMSGRFLPAPRLDLGEIYIGDAKQFQAATAQINFEILGVFGDSKPISSVDFQNVKVRGIALRDSAAWLQKLAGSTKFPVSSMTVSQGTLDADAFQLTGIDGQLNFSPVGKFTHAQFSANAGKYTVSINSAPGAKLLADIKVSASALPLLPSWNFDELDAKGEISNDQLLVSEFDGRILGGTLHGNARINWNSGWHADGTLTAKKIVMKDFTKLLDGNVDGSGHFKMSSTDLAGLTDSAVLEGNFSSADGLIGGLDIVETARMHSMQNLPGGRTHYDGLSGDFSYAKDGYHFSQVKINGGVMSALAAFDVSNQQLSGKMKVNLALNGQASADLKLGGAIDNPTLVYQP